MPFKGVYLCGSLFPSGKFIEERTDPKGQLGAGGSVATSAWDFCRLLGAREIWIAGLDLAFPQNKTHFKGALFEEKALSASRRLNPVETWLFHALRDGIPFLAASISGGHVLTDRRLSLYASWFENNFRQHPGIKNFSLSADGRATEGGLGIAGLEAAATETLLALPERREEIDRRIEERCSLIETAFFAPDEKQQRANRYDNATAALHSGLERITAACKKGETIAAEALRRGNGSAGREKALTTLDEINRFITGSEVKEIAGFLFPPEALAEIDEAGSPINRYLQSLINFYRSLAEAVNFMLFPCQRLNADCK
jgi:hypothetical protein